MGYVRWMETMGLGSHCIMSLHRPASALRLHGDAEFGHIDSLPKHQRAPKYQNTHAPTLLRTIVPFKVYIVQRVTFLSSGATKPSVYLSSLRDSMHLHPALIAWVIMRNFSGLKWNCHEVLLWEMENLCLFHYPLVFR